MTVQGRVTLWRIAAASCSAAFWSRYSLRNFTEFLFHCAHFFKHFEDALGFVLVNDADRESDVNQDVFADFRLGRVGKIHFFADAPEIDLADAESDVASIGDLDDAARNGETHKRTSAAKAAIS